MPIVTECPHCDRPVMVAPGPGAFAPLDCEDCGGRMVIEMTRVGGTTYSEDVFVADVLPKRDGIERIDHPTADAYVYGDPDRVGIRETNQS